MPFGLEPRGVEGIKFEVDVRINARSSRRKEPDNLRIEVEPYAIGVQERLEGLTTLLAPAEPSPVRFLSGGDHRSADLADDRETYLSLDVGGEHAEGRRTMPENADELVEQPFGIGGCRVMPLPARPFAGRVRLGPRPQRTDGRLNPGKTSDRIRVKATTPNLELQEQP